MNHHGGEKDASTDSSGNPNGKNVIKVSPADLISRDEKVEFEARKQFYESLQYTRKRAQRMERLQFVGKTIFPVLIILFSTSYFLYGFSQMDY